MNAIIVRQFGGPEVLRLETVPDPQPGAGEVVVRNHAIGVNPVETYIRQGTYTSKPALPYTPGSDAAGIVEAVGAEVARVKPGDRVYVYGGIGGTYADLTLTREWQLHPLPARASFEQGAVGVPAGAAWRALFPRGRAEAGETVLVHGATGTVGISAVQLARAAGLTVIGTAGSDAGIAAAREAGAHFAFRHDDYDAIRAQTPGGKGVPLIIEMLADKNLEGDLKLLTPRGRVVVVGSRGATQFEPRWTMATELDIRGMSLSNMTQAENEAMSEALVAALASGVLQPVIGPQFALADAAKAHEAVMSGRTEGKITLKP